MMLLNRKGEPWYEKGQRCDAEIGRPGKGWHACKKPAKFKAKKQIRHRYGANCFSLYYCDKHVKRANENLKCSMTLGIEPYEVSR